MAESDEDFQETQESRYAPAAFEPPSSWPSAEHLLEPPILPPCPKMSSYPPTMSATGNESSEKETAPTYQHPATPAPSGYYMPRTHGEPHHPAGGSAGQVPAYNEIDDNPLPQLVLGDAMPEVFKTSPAVYPDAVREDFVSGPIPVGGGGEEQQSNSAAEDPWYKRHTVLAVIGTVAVVAILAILFGTLGGLGVFTNNRNSSTSASSDPAQNPSSTSSLSTAAPTSSPASSTTSVAATLSSTSSATPPTLQPPHQCTDTSKFIQNISFVVGNGDRHGLGWTLPKASSQAECCTICYFNTLAGCDIWVWSPYDHPTVPCTIVMGYLGGAPDSKCQYGYPNSTAFTIQLNGTGVGSSGPCGSGGLIVPGSGNPG
ncbi:hypothetical protein CONLIGDRAFT_642855 [Coniochaeta ligniaria NRRL 30616]|uniref:Apple domain-containing protein n=1 Tax=Coniochaeta ligniaria NRRL 30616 TaxID=1408157 RepID=A0A1J7JLR1_9PEZI|nr:hypothetical protein CONLIGDRAFT_642855 [Coniochaeta ligniaria NRRL 30616]